MHTLVNRPKQLLIAALLLSASCAEAPKAEQPPIVVIDEPDQATAKPDMGTPPQDAGDDQGPTLPSSPSCQAQGLAATRFMAGGEAKWDGLAGDFTLQTKRGPWTLSEAWTGCDSFIFIQHDGGQLGAALWANARGGLAGLMANAAPNAHIFFGAYGQSAEAIGPQLDQISEAIQGALGSAPDELRVRWAQRLHVITEPVNKTTGALGQLLAAQAQPVYAVGVDLEQRFDQGGAPYNIGPQGFTPDLSVAAYLPRYYNYRRKLNDQLTAQADAVTVVKVIDAKVTENNALYKATFPSAEAMQAFDTLEIEVNASCGPRPKEDCGEWDYEAYLERCRTGSADCAERDQVALWITPYARPGHRRWLVDATPFLGLLKEGGEQTFRFGMLWNMNPNQMLINFRLSSSGQALKPHRLIPLFEGGDFDAQYNSKHAPQAFTRQPEDKRVELVALLTGHGQTEGNNCAEWCDHEHTFGFGPAQAPVKMSFPNQAGAPMGCAQQADQGVVPGQWGNWTPGRAAWCPGLIVKPWRVDVTDRFTAGQESTITYQGSYQGKEPAGGRIRLSAYLAVYR